MTTLRPLRRRPRSRGDTLLNWALIVLMVLFHIVAVAVLAWTVSLLWPSTGPTAVPAVVDPAPRVQISPASGTAGTVIRVQGNGWHAGDSLIVCLDDLGDPAEPPIYARVRASESGTFQAAFAFPQDVAWQSVPIIPVVVESRDHAQKASAAFNLLDITPTAVPTEPPPTQPPTPTPLPTATPVPPTATPPPPTATPGCRYDARFVADVTIPDDTELLPGAAVLKIWRLRNTGNCDWPEGTTAVLVSGAPLGGPASVPVLVAAPGNTSDVGVYLTAPTVAGTHTGTWQLRLPDGRLVGQRFFVRIVVLAPTSVATATTNVTPVATVTLMPTATPLSGVGGTGWQGAYYANGTLSGGPVMMREDTAVDFAWSDGAPAPSLPADVFSVRWTRIAPFEEGVYRFYARMDDGMRVFVDDAIVINEWRDGMWRDVSADVWLTGGDHEVRVEYYENHGEALARVSWERVNVTAGWRGEYWDNPDLDGLPVLVRNDAWVDFNWGYGAPAARVPDEEFSARWTRTWLLDPGTYRIAVRADDGVRVFVDGNLVIDEWRLSGGGRVYEHVMPLNGRHTIVIEYFEEHYGAEIHFAIERLAA